MERESLLKRYLIFIVGLYFLAMGITLIVHSTLGTTPISSMNYVLSINTPFSLGTWTFVINLIMILVQLWLTKGKYGTRKDTVEILLQVPFSFIFSAFIDLNMWFIRDLVPANYAMAMGILLMGCLIQSVGVVLEIKPKVAMMSAEGLVKYIARRCHKEFGNVKVYVDVALVSMAVLISLVFTMRIEGVREGSVIAACITGYIVNFLNRRVMTRKMLYRFIPLRSE